MCSRYLHILSIPLKIAAAFNYVSRVLAAHVKITAIDKYGRMQFTCTIPASAAGRTPDSRRAIQVLAAADNVAVHCNLTDVSMLGGLHTLAIMMCPVGRHIGVLANVHTLNAAYCGDLTDVSALGGVHTLNISHCVSITDVSALGQVHELDLSGCRGVTDVSALGRVHILVR